MANSTPEEHLTQRQREVLALIRQGSTPTEIGRVLGVSSQAVHGHLRRLRGHGVIPDKTWNAQTQRGQREHAEGEAFDATQPLVEVREAIEGQIAAVEQHLDEIDGDLAALEDQRVALEDTLHELRRLAGRELPTESTIPLLP